MSCRLYNDSASVQAVSWPSADGSPSRAIATSRALVESDAAQAELTGRRIAEVEAQAERRIREAHAAGVVDGRRAAGSEIESAMVRVGRSVDELARMKAKLRKEAEADLVKLALAVARRILHRELTVDSDALQGVVNAAMERLQLRDVFQVRVYPAHESIVRQSLANAQGSSVQVIADRSLQPGDLIFETARGALDASLDSQLNEIERGFADILSR